MRKKDVCILVEGYMDVIIANQAGFENVVATSGTALTPYQLRILKRYSNNLLTAFDMDVAGDTATKRGIDLAQAQGFNIKVVTMSQDTDPADIISENPKDWQNFLEQAKSIHDFYFENTLSRFDKNALEGKKEISKILLPVIKRIPNRIEQTLWIQSLTKTLGVKEEDVLEELKKIALPPNEFATGQGIEQIVKDTTSLPQKTRKELLEERLAILIIKSPKNLDLIKEEDFEIFSPQVSQLVNHFKKEGVNLNRTFPTELNDLVNLLSLRAEIEPSFVPLTGGTSEGKEIDVETEKEFRSCLKEIRTLIIKNKLDGISKEIKKAEEEKDFEKVQQLVQKFNHHSKSWNDLEISEI